MFTMVVMNYVIRGRDELGRLKCRQKDNIKVDVGEVG
jgi:hypothetical protein